MTTCPACTGPVLRKPGPGRPPQYCSPTCWRASYRARLAERRAAEPPLTTEALIAALNRR